MRLLLPALLAALLVVPARAQTSADAAAAEGPCAVTLAAARAAYVASSFVQTREAVAACLAADGATAADSVAAYRLEVLAALRTDDPAAARQALLLLLGTRPAYEPDPVRDPPAFVVFADDVRRQLGLAAAPHCDARLAEAAARLDAGDPDAAAGHVDTCMAGPLVAFTHRREAQRLRTLIALARGDLRAARTAAEQLLALAPEFDTAGEPPPLAALVRLVRARAVDRLP